MTNSVPVKSAGQWTEDEERAYREARCLYIDELLAKYPDSPDIAWCQVLAVLLDNDVVWINEMWWREDLPKDARKLTGISVTCNDVFAWGCSDGEDMMHADLIDVYQHWRKDARWGSAVWCMKRRNQMPQKPVERSIREGGIWNLDSMGLGSNTMDAEVAASFAAIAPAIRAKIEAEKQGAAVEVEEQVRSEAKPSERTP